MPIFPIAFQGFSPPAYKQSLIARFVFSGKMEIVAWVSSGQLTNVLTCNLCREMHCLHLKALRSVAYCTTIRCYCTANRSYKPFFPNRKHVPCMGEKAVKAEKKRP